MGNATCTYAAARIRENVPPCPPWVLPCVMVILMCAILFVVRLLYAHHAHRETRNFRRGNALPRWARSSPRHSATAETVLPPKPNFNITQLPEVPLPFELENSACAICLEPLQLSAVAKGPCEHVLHKKCFSSWLARDASSSCPICRASFEPIILDPARHSTDATLYDLNELYEIILTDSTSTWAEVSNFCCFPCS